MAGSQQKLFDAVFAGKLSAVKRALKEGASLRRGDKNGLDALYCAVSASGVDPARHRQLIEFLISSGANIEKRYSYLSGFTPLICAASGGHETSAEVLLDAGADIEAADDHGYTALMRAALGGHSSIVALLLQRGADPGKKNRSKETAQRLAEQELKEGLSSPGAAYAKTIEFLKRAKPRKR